MRKYELPDAVGLFSQHTSIINGLWTVYVAATFTAAGFGASGRDISVTASLAITVGFWAFTLGHLHLLRQALSINRSLGREINSALASDTDAMDCQFRSSIQRLATTVTLPWTPIVIHLLIDVCVTIALWARVLW